MSEEKLNLATFRPKNPIMEHTLKLHSGYVWLRENSSEHYKSIYDSIIFLEQEVIRLEKLKRSNTEKFTIEESRLILLLYKHFYDAYHSVISLGEKMGIVVFMPNPQGDSCE